MSIVYLDRMGGDGADVSYNTAWAGIWALAEISLGITVIGTVMLPKFIEAKGTKLRGIFSGLPRSLTSLTSGVSLGSFMQAKRGAAVQEVALDTLTIIGSSESDAGSSNQDRDVERYPSYESFHTQEIHPGVSTTDNSHRPLTQ